ncbi:N-acetyltransferase [Roseibium denhamense]|uniref:Protein N-acetyltransferase, RimJ/RimL family n=1 Tax=Roseibium denhamense TaxID=76305 RepID=A0ABY1PKC9_9HYPH|nr:GNAT family N-acetyltransferase [Roseibium denhamense]MTI05515.1 N-acetyltransferase [Roseibium denhamense]SMP35164.1 Protein N-acetyltransferase, RimJ/RimL family [Roseibium denhamense]
MIEALATTDRLVLRIPRLSDLETCARLLGDYEVAKMLARVAYPYDMEAGKAYLANAVKNWGDVRIAPELAFHIDREGEMIGCIGFKKLQETPELGYWLGRPFWGMGYMHEALPAAINWVFENTSHDLIAAEAMTENPASLKVMDRIGFRTVGEVGCASAAREATLPAIRKELQRADFVFGL